MSYLRGDYYLWRDGNRQLHIWARNGCDGWHDSVWAETSGQGENDSGVQVPQEVMDRYVVMRLAELLVQKRAVAMLDAVVPPGSELGNGGEAALRSNLDRIRSSLVALERQCVAPWPEFKDDDDS
jgi:hypothetical protein